MRGRTPSGKSKTAALEGGKWKVEGGAMRKEGEGGKG